METRKANYGTQEAHLEELRGKEVWEREYGYLHSIPGSLREAPAKVLVELWRDVPPLSTSPLVLDAGCGAGRNALFLARQGCRVHAIDSCSAALRIFRQRLCEFPERDLINIGQLTLVPPLPLPDDFFHVVLDMYVSCHFIEEELLASYWKEIHRTLVPGGFAVAAFFSISDEYYLRLLSKLTEDSAPVVRDPVNGIAKRLYTAQSLENLFGAHWKIRKLLSLDFEDDVGGRMYRRRVLGLLMQK